MHKRPEILAPVANLEMALAAIHNGADAIYVGFPGFNARGRTATLTLEAFREILDLCRFHGVKVHAALNVLVFENELHLLIEPASQLITAGLDAFIVQDLGVAQMLRKLSPEIELHASTQMTVTAAEAIELTADLDLSRYVLARELSLDEIAAVRKNTTKEIEVFVHGALCVSYSGQCLTSESFGGRSANRGQCAQSCRLDYDLIVDGEKKELGGKSHLVSPQDLCGLNEISQLMALGVDCFKIEGRLKSAGYVALTARSYREAEEKALLPETPEATPTLAHPAGPDTTRSDLAIAYSRGFFPGWLHGVDHQKLVPATSSDHRGLPLGPILHRSEGKVEVRNLTEIQAGDGMLFVHRTTHESVGGRIYSAKLKRDGNSVQEHGVWQLTFDHQLAVQRLDLNWEAFLNDSPAREKEIARSWKEKQERKGVAVTAVLQGDVGQPLNLSLYDGQNESVASSDTLLAAAQSAPFDPSVIREEMRGVSAHGFDLVEIQFKLPQGLFLPAKLVRKLRQQAAETLRNCRLQIPERILTPKAEVETFISPETPTLPAPKETARLHLLLREKEQIEILAGGHRPDVDTVYLDFEYGRDYKPSLQRLRDLGYKAGLATTRITKPLERHNLTVIEKLQPDAVLVRNLAAFQVLRPTGLSLIGDFSLNATNHLTSAWLLEKGLERLTPSYDLNQWQLLDLLKATGGSRFEVTVHQWLPAFHMEHCVFAAFLSSGSSFRDCGKPCEQHRVELRDHTGALHPLKADQECRNTMFNGKPQSSVRLIPSLLAAGVRHFRVEALWEDATTLLATLDLYKQAITGHSTPDTVLQTLRWQQSYGVSEGQLRNEVVWEDRKRGA